MNKLYEYKKKSDSPSIYINLLATASLVLASGKVLFSSLETTEKIGGIMLCAIVLFLIFKYNPIRYDKITIWSESIQITKKGKGSKTILFDDIESASGSNSLVLKMKSGEEEVIKFSSWLLPLKEIKQINEIVLSKV